MLSAFYKKKMRTTFFSKLSTNNVKMLSAFHKEKMLTMMVAIYIHNLQIFFAKWATNPKIDEFSVFRCRVQWSSLKNGFYTKIWHFRRMISNYPLKYCLWVFINSSTKDWNIATKFRKQTNCLLQIAIFQFWADEFPKTQ